MRGQSHDDGFEAALLEQALRYRTPDSVAEADPATDAPVRQIRRVSRNRHARRPQRRRHPMAGTVIAMILVFCTAMLGLVGAVIAVAAAHWAVVQTRTSRGWRRVLSRVVLAVAYLYLLAHLAQGFIRLQAGLSFWG